MSPPNAITQTASVVLEPPSVVVLYINAPFAVKEADEKVTSLKSVNAVVLVNQTPVLVKVAPPADSKLCLPCKSSCLKLEHIADDIAIT